MSASLILDNIACDRGGRRLFEGILLRLEPGQAALVRGANGRGKSSLLRLMAGLLEPVAGTLTISGTRALADENLALDRESTVEEALGFWAALDCKGATEAAMTAFGLSHLAEVPVRMLSTGQRKRAVLARTVASGAGIWLLDEPGNGLDQPSLASLKNAVQAHLQTGGIAIVASHQPLGLKFDETISL